MLLCLEEYASELMPVCLMPLHGFTPFPLCLSIVRTEWKRPMKAPKCQEPRHCEIGSKHWPVCKKRNNKILPGCTTWICESSLPN